ncbi:Putative acetyl-CoA C-acetyltransferase YhfS [Aquimixticola soesokkakensis]|uniref:Putative acetyl-CoA C-acetyltransferase YhfS n=1 Tax=Aquimixticola soesokkakensis TaxID=1519096 RepID=A0A1Y5TLC2_9RHOB|nr:thiolase family protein [Aquimixticola soesokkakensis]SLN63045.1 Putative acetyl-CoA C-acetyltransferase YhfS [Aquimixticola soesokkakensis]
MSGVWITGAARTPVVPRGGALARLELPDLGAPVVRAALAQAGLDAGQVGEVILSNALGGGGNPARLVALAAGLPERVAGLSIDRQCAGGLDALVLGAALIRAGQAEVVVAGGVESYSRRPLRLRTDPDGGAPVAFERPPFTPWPARDPEMVDAAQAQAQRLGISRAAQDDWAIESHRKARAARFGAGEIVPLAGATRDAFTRNLSPRLCARAPMVSATISAATAAVAADGAAFCVLVSDRVAQQSGAMQAVEYLDGVTLGGDPECPGVAPVAAIKAVLSGQGMGARDLAVAEIMEAYSVQAMACVELAALAHGIVNRGGGALARGHPIGASGTINAVRLVHELCAQPCGAVGVAAIAAAGGLGTAVLMRRSR